MFALGVILVVVALLFTIPSGAAILTGPSDSLNDEVAIQPGDNPYTFLDDNGKLVVDITGSNPRLNHSGVSVDSLSVEDELFYITYSGSEPAEVWIADDSPAVSFAIDGQPAANETAPARIVPGNEPIPVSINIDTRVVEATPGDILIRGITINAEPADPQSVATGSVVDDRSDTETVTVESPDPATREVKIFSLTAGQETETDLSGLNVGSSAVEIEQLDIIPDESGNAELDVEGYETPPESVEPVDRSGVDPLGYYDVTFEEPAPQITEATATLAVDRRQLETAGVAPDQLAAYHETDEGWETTTLNLLETDGETVRIEISSDGFSAFALASQRSALDPIEADPATETVASDKPVTVEVTVENVGSAPASNVTLQLKSAEGGDDGVPVIDQGTFVVDAATDTAATQSVTIHPDEPGTYNLVVEGPRVKASESVGSLTVTDTAELRDTSTTDEPEPEVAADVDSQAGNDTTTDGSDSTASDPETTGADSSSGQSGLERTDLVGLAVLVVVVLLTAMLVRRVSR